MNANPLYDGLSCDFFGRERILPLTRLVAKQGVHMNLNEDKVRVSRSMVQLFKHTRRSLEDVSREIVASTGIARDVADIVAQYQWTFD